MTNSQPLTTFHGDYDPRQAPLTVADQESIIGSILLSLPDPGRLGAWRWQHARLTLCHAKLVYEPEWGAHKLLLCWDDEVLPVQWLVEAPLLTWRYGPSVRAAVHSLTHAMESERNRVAKRVIR